MQTTILGHYITQFGELWNHSLTDLFQEASLGAIKNAGVQEAEIEAVFVANMGAGQTDNQLHLGALVSQMITGYPNGVRVEGACASGGLALIMA
jgi:acetyl-CoA acetyltransferase